MGYGEEPPDQLLANPRNWRIHSQFQQDVLDGALREVGWAQNVIVNQRTGHLIDGHMRVALAMRASMPNVPVTYVDLAEDEEAKILASLDSIGGLAVMDAEQMGELLKDMHVDDAAFARFIDGLHDQEELTTLIPDREQPDAPSRGDGLMLRVTLSVENAEVLERALAACGERTRARALVKICEHYLASKSEVSSPVTP